MADALGIETRSRSRSKTPGLFGENGDSDKRNAKKIPTISLIEEEDDVVEVIPSSQTSQGSRPKRQRRSAKAVASDTSADVSAESQKASVVSKTVTTTIVTESVKKTTNGKEESSEQASSTTITTKSAIDGQDAPESQSIFNNIFNAIKTSTPILSTKRSQRITQDITSPLVNIGEHPAYKEYKEAGEYWNKYPKTDYTYSELSPHRRELKNGVVAMPNMSRRSLEKYQNRVEVMIQNNPLEESFLRRKFLSTTNTSFQKRSADLQYDSTDEVDTSEYRRLLQNRRKPTENVISRFFLMIVSYIYSSYYSVSQRFRRVFYRTNKRYTYTPIRNQHGFFRRVSESIKKFVLLGFSKVYLFVSTVLCLDTWILYTRSDNADKNARRKRFLLLLLILLPLLLLGALLLSDDNQKYLDITAFRAPDLTPVRKYFSNLSTPRLPSWNFNPSLSLNWFWTPFLWLGAGLRSFIYTNRSKEDLKLHLDDDRLQGIIAHIERYIDLALVGKFEENNKIVTEKTNEKMTIIISKTVNDALNNYHYQLTAHDIEIIASRIKSQIEKDFSEREQAIVGKFTLSSNDQLLKLQEQVKQNIDLKFTEIKLDSQNVNLDDVLSAVLNSKKLSILIDGKIQPAIDKLSQHDREIASLKLDLQSLKADVVEKFVEIDSGFTDIWKNLGEDFIKLRQENDERLKILLMEIDSKLASFGDSHFTSVDDSVRNTLFTILGINKATTDGKMNEAAFKNWIGSIFVAKSELEERLLQVETNSNQAFKLQLNENAGILMNEINEEIKKQVALSMAAKVDLGAAGNGLSEADVLKIVKGVLAVYDADKTGLVDFALESAGGQVLSTRCTENYQIKSAEISIFGIPLWYPSNTPRTVISPSVQPGECWAFQGFPGYLVVQLNNLIHITGFSYEHIPQSLAPNSIIDSAPNNFTVWGLVTELDKDPVMMGSYYFSAEQNAPSLQYFPVQNKLIDQPYQIIELRVESNHGNPRYTCLYRFRVHGDVVKH